MWAGLCARILSLLLEMNPEYILYHSNALYATLFLSIIILAED
jgi:hypothetical protein